jgi:transcriptional regulator with XRE-family HTH domain
MSATARPRHRQAAPVTGFAAYQRILGDELRAVRKQLGWTRKQLQHRLLVDVSLQTLATYELGTRQCSVLRLAHLCRALDVLPQDLLARVHARAFGADSTGCLRVDLRVLAADRRPALAPLRHWAAARLSDGTTTAGDHTDLDLAALESMAALCRMTTVDMITAIRTVTEL